MRASPAKYNLAFPAGTFYTAGETPRAPRGTELASSSLKSLIYLNKLVKHKK